MDSTALQDDEVGHLQELSCPFLAKLHPGKVLYEMKGVSEAVAHSAMRIAAYKTPCWTQS